MRSWLNLTAWSLLICLVLFLLVPLGAATAPKRQSPEVWLMIGRMGLDLAAATVGVTAAMYLPHFFTWPRREQMLEVTPDSIVVVRIDRWRRVRREVPVAAVKEVWSFQNQVVAFDGKRNHLLLEFLPAAEARRWAETVREALGLPRAARA